MKYNLEHFSKIMETQLKEEAKEIVQQSDILSQNKLNNYYIFCFLKLSNKTLI